MITGHILAARDNKQQGFFGPHTNSELIIINMAGAFTSYPQIARKIKL